MKLPEDWEAGGPAHPELTAHEAHLWLARLDCPGGETARLEGFLCPEEKRRSSRLRSSRGRLHWIVARAFLRDALSRYVAVAPGELAFQYSEAGKPSLDDPAKEIEFNLSHSGSLALLAVARGRRVGVDIERRRPGYIGDDVARRFFSPAENAALFALPPEQRSDGFYRCWTRKEAYVKGRGESLAARLRQFTVSLAPDAVSAVLDDPQQDPSRWRLHDVPVDPDYAAALAVEGEISALRHWFWPGATA